MTEDLYQERYLEYQTWKRSRLLEMMKKRYSERIFNDKQINSDAMEIIFDAIDKVPSSCNRKAIEIKVISGRDEKQILSGLLVGGVGWIHRADKIMLLIADWAAYKEKLLYMPYLDAGIIIQQVYLISTELNIGCCYCNPNIRHEHDFAFRKLFMENDDSVFCGAIALGYKETL